jgi:hypothetical protein
LYEKEKTCHTVGTAVTQKQFRVVCNSDAMGSNKDVPVKPPGVFLFLFFFLFISFSGW